MPIYRKCTECSHKVLDGTLCICEEKKRKESYKAYKQRRIQDLEEKKRQQFYSSDEWLNCRGNVSAHQFGLDLIEWSKEKIIAAETYHHVFEVREDWNRRLDDGNIIGLTEKNHKRVHALMNRSNKDKVMIQGALQALIKKFDEEYY